MSDSAVVLGNKWRGKSIFFFPQPCHSPLVWPYLTSSLLFSIHFDFIHTAHEVCAVFATRTVLPSMFKQCFSQPKVRTSETLVI